MNDRYKMTLHLTVGTIGKIRLKNHLTLLLRFHILFSVTGQKQETHHAKAEEKEKSQTTKVSDIVAIHAPIMPGFCFQSSSVSKIQPLKFTTFMTSISRTSGLWGR